MTECYHAPIDLPSVQRQKVRLEFGHACVTSDAGAQLLRLADRRLGLTESLSRALPDDRVQGRCKHTLRDLLRQRIYSLALGYEDLNDSQHLRHDKALCSATEVGGSLASPATLCRFEQRAGLRETMLMHEVLVEQFINSYDAPPRRLILDLDATDNPIYGDQEGKYFNTHYDHHCFLPLYVFCGKQLLVSYLRSASHGAAHHAPAVTSLLVRRLRAAWPRVQIVLRADAGFCVPRLLHWCDRHGVHYVIGISKNSRLLAASEETRDYAEQLYGLTGKRQQLFSEFYYRARSWPHERRIIVKAEHNHKSANPRFIVTSLTSHRAKWLYTRFYCARGDMENRIKEQIQLFSMRTSCHRWWPNQFRLLLSGLSYVLLDGLRRLALQGTHLATAYASTLRLKLLKVGAVIISKASRLVLQISSHYPEAALFRQSLQRLLSG